MGIIFIETLRGQYQHVWGHVLRSKRWGAVEINLNSVGNRTVHWALSGATCHERIH